MPVVSRLSLPAFLLWLLCLPLWANAAEADTALSGKIPMSGPETVVLDEGPVALYQFPMHYFVDRTENLPFDQVRQQRFTPSGNKLSLGTGAKTTWSRVRLHNRGTQERRLFLHHPYAYHNRQVLFYEQRDTGFHLQRLDLDDADRSPLMYRGSAVFEFRLAPGAAKTLYVKSVSFSHQWFSLLILDEDQSRRALLGIGAHNDIALMVGILLALVIYNALLYFSASQRENVFYSLYLVSGAIWIALSYGLFASLFDVYGEHLLPLHLSLMTMPIFLILFMMDIFRTVEKHRIEHRLLQGILLLLLADFSYGLFDIVGALQYASSLAALMMLVTLGVSLSLIIKGDPLAKYFLFGHSLFVLFSAIAVLFYKGLIEFNYVTSHGVGIGIMLESLMLAFIIAYRIRMLEALKASQEELRLQAVTDPLTRLYNRRYFYTEARYLLQQAIRQKSPTALIMLDIDAFKRINDSYGHATGDAVIRALADHMRAVCRPGDLVARFGGEEFVILLPQTDTGCAEALAEQLRTTVEAQAVAYQSGVLNFTISLGVTGIRPEHETLETALNLADIALYEAKNSGRNQVRVSRCQLGPEDETLLPE